MQGQCRVSGWPPVSQLACPTLPLLTSPLPSPPLPQIEIGAEGVANSYTTQAEGNALNTYQAGEAEMFDEVVHAVRPAPPLQPWFFHLWYDSPL